MRTLDRMRAHQRCDESGLRYIRAYQIASFCVWQNGHFCGAACSFHGTEVAIAWEIKASNFWDLIHISKIFGVLFSNFLSYDFRNLSFSHCLIST